MLDKLRLVEDKYMELEQRAMQPDFYSDPKQAAPAFKGTKGFRAGCHGLPKLLQDRA